MGGQKVQIEEEAFQRGRSNRATNDRNSIGSRSRSRSLSRQGRRVVEPEVVLPAMYRSVSIGVDDYIAERTSKSVAKSTSKEAEATSAYATTEWHTLPGHVVCENLSTSTTVGLTEPRAAAKLKEYGYNVHTSPPSRILHKLFMYFFGGFGSLLLIGGILCCIAWKPLGNPDPSAANLALGVVLFLVFFIQAGFNGWQDWSSSRVMASISSMVPEDTLVLREAKTCEIPTKELVPGDIVYVKPGVKVPADLRLLNVSPDLKFDRAMLTGESKPVAGSSKAAELGTNYLEVENIAMQGSYCVSGTGTGVVVSTGDHTVFGNIAKLSSIPKRGLTPMQKEILRFVLLVVGFVVSIIAVVVAVW